jgi:hypothetical protein
MALGIRLRTASFSKLTAEMSSYAETGQAPRPAAQARMRIRHSEN